MTVVESDADLSLAELVSWVDLWFGQVTERRFSNRLRWCARWWEHPEAVIRMRVLHASWLQVTRHGDALTYSTWMLDHFDRHLDRLMDSDGPFSSCNHDRHHAGRHGLPVRPAE